MTAIIALEQALPQTGLGSAKKQIIMIGIGTVLKATAIETGTLAAERSNTKTNTTSARSRRAASEFTDTTVKILTLAKAGPFGTTETEITSAPTHDAARHPALRRC